VLVLPGTVQSGDLPHARTTAQELRRQAAASQLAACCSCSHRQGLPSVAGWSCHAAMAEACWLYQVHGSCEYLQLRFLLKLRLWASLRFESSTTCIATHQVPVLPPILKQVHSVFMTHPPDSPQVPAHTTTFRCVDKCGTSHELKTLVRTGPSNAGHTYTFSTCKTVAAL
jgi:hypothetical protein